MNDKRKEFLESVLDCCDYWKDKPENVYGLAFSIFVMCDGCSSLNDFETIELKGITQKGRELHTDFCELRSERNEKV